MRNWKVAGIVAAAVIVLSIPVYLARVRVFHAPGSRGKEEVRFVGSQACKPCHKREYELWKGSDHDHAMDVARQDTVRGDFDDAVVEAGGVISRFYRRNGRFYVHIEGLGGKPGEFEILYTFGWYPLQQYLVGFPGGRLQCLPVAWDVEGRRWYHLYQGNPPDPEDWLYWTRGGQNWNGMCAECHSTNLRKNYDPGSDTYRTTWSEIDVGCEACHGPGSRHVAWAELPDMARPDVRNVDLVVRTSGIGSRAQVELCAPCHSRRAILADYAHAEADLLDSMLPELLTEGLYFPDGQILGEVYVYGSFTQSKMYHRDVRCSDCHDVHSGKRLREGNQLCLQCHRAGEFDTTIHHFHKKKGEKGEPIRAKDGTVLFEVGTGSECVGCHMPGRVYMGVDYRPDHSFRIPRPDLTVRLGTPNACNHCHMDKSPQWADEMITKWYGPGRRFHYGEIIEQGRRVRPEALKRLVRLAADPLYPVIVRATALSLLGSFPENQTRPAFEQALSDREPLIRRTAVAWLKARDPAILADLLVPLLYDPIKAVRIEAARRLAEAGHRSMTPEQEGVYEATLEEWKASMTYSADFPSGRYNLGNLYTALGQPEKAIRQYRAAIRIDDLFFPAKVNLAMLYDQEGKKKEAEGLFREVLAAYPDLHEVAYSLGLLLAEEERYEEAAGFLRRAARGMPRRARVHYNLGLLLHRMALERETEAELLKAVEIEPRGLDYLYAVASFYLDLDRLPEARGMAERIVDADPSNPLGPALMTRIERRQGR